MAMTSSVVLLDKSASLAAEVRSHSDLVGGLVVVLSVKEAEHSASGTDIHMSVPQLEALDVLIRAALAEIDDYRIAYGEKWHGTALLATTRTEG